MRADWLEVDWPPRAPFVRNCSRNGSETRAQTIARALAPLRSGTRDAHERLESRLRRELLSETAVSYVDVLSRLLGVYAPLESRLESQLQHHWPALDLVARRKVPLLRADLADLGLTRQMIAAVPQCAYVPAPVSSAEALGCLYVLEGATLGGKVILRAVAASALRDGRRGGAFFGAYGSLVGQRWREFTAVVADATAAGADPAVIVSGARETFAAMEEWLCR